MSVNVLWEGDGFSGCERRRTESFVVDRLTLDALQCFAVFDGHHLDEARQLSVEILQDPPGDGTAVYS